MNPTILSGLGVAGKWGGRLIALLLLVFWGAFFVDHLSEWFLQGGGRYPPRRVWIQQFFHLAMLVGFGLMLKWDRLGSVVVLASGTAFFGGILLQDSRFEYRIVLFALASFLPVACFAVYWLSPSSARR